MFTAPNKTAKVTAGYDFPAANTNAVVTLAATSGVIHVIKKISGSYSGTLASAPYTLTVAIGGTTVWSVALSAVGTFDFDFPDGLHGAENTAVVVTLPAGGASGTGKLNVSYQ